MSRAAILALLAITGCGRVHFDPLDSLASNGDGTTQPACRWDVPFSMSPPEPITELNTPNGDAEPFLMPDGLHLYFANDTGSGGGVWDLYLATRQSPDVPFTSVVPITTLNTNMSETHMTVSSDGSAAWLSAQYGRPTPDIFRAARNGLDAFGAPVLEATLSTPDAEYDPAISRDGLRLYVMRAYSLTDAEIMVAERTSTSDPFGVPRAIPELDSINIESNPAIAHDDRLVVFASTRPGVGGLDLWYATRPDRDAMWSTPAPVPGVNTAVDDSESFVTEDGCELWFSTIGVFYDLHRSRYIAL